MNPEETPLEPTPTEGTSTEEPSPSSETVELQLVNEKLEELKLVNEKLQLIVEEMTKEPTPEELAAQEEELAAQQETSQTYEQTTLENSATELELLQEISDKLSTLETTSTDQHSQTLVHYENTQQMQTEQTWTIVFAITVAIGFKLVSDNMTKW